MKGKIERGPIISLACETVDFTHNAYCIQMIQKCFKNNEEEEKNEGKKENNK